MHQEMHVCVVWTMNTHLYSVGCEMPVCMVWALKLMHHVIFTQSFCGKMQTVKRYLSPLPIPFYLCLEAPVVGLLFFLPA